MDLKLWDFGRITRGLHDEAGDGGVAVAQRHVVGRVATRRAHVDVNIAGDEGTRHCQLARLSDHRVFVKASLKKSDSLLWSVGVS